MKSEKERSKIILPTGFQCHFCERYDAESNRCPAFPRGIPQDVFDGYTEHKRVLPGQTGDFVFELYHSHIIEDPFPPSYPQLIED